MALVFVLAALLCCLYASDTIIISWYYRYYTHNPVSSKLLFLAEWVKLLVALGLLADERGRAAAATAAGQRQPGAAAAATAAAAVAAQQHHHQQQPLKQDAAGVPGPGAAAAAGGPRSWLHGLALFSVPSLCYFLTNNLSFYALTLMPAHVYTLLCDLKIITTGLLNYLVLDKRLNRHAVASLVVLFAGICVGQAATTRPGPHAAAALGARAGHSWAAGAAVMLLVATLSAVASVYTEWAMNHSRYRHESLNLQNCRLYTVGILLNGLYFLQSGGGLADFFGDMRGPHWAVVFILAFMGLITGVLIKHYGNIVKVYASSVASLFAAWLSHLILRDPPPPLFYVGVLLAMAATLQLQRARSSLSIGAAASGDADRRACGAAAPQQRQRLQGLTSVVLATAVLVAVPYLLPWTRAGAGHAASAALPGANGSRGPPLPVHHPAGEHNPLDAGPGVGPMPVLPPFPPACFVPWERRVALGCPVLNCSLADACGVDDRRCCAHLLMLMLEDFDELAFGLGLDGQYALAFGSLLGAATQQALQPQRPSAALAVTPTAVQALERNETRQQLWERGYALWHDQPAGLWRLCPHARHPSPAVRAAMLPGAASHADFEAAAGHQAGGGLELHLMWRAPASSTSSSDPGGGPCEQASAAPAAAATLVEPRPGDDVPWGALLDDSQGGGELSSQQALQQEGEQLLLQQLGQQQEQEQDAGPEQPQAQEWLQGQEQAQEQEQQRLAQAASTPGGRVFCLQFSRVPLVLQPGTRPANLSGVAFPGPVNAAAHLTSAFGPLWQRPLPHAARHLVREGAAAADAGPPDWPAVQAALLERLSATAWGGGSYAQRLQRCGVRQADGQEGLETLVQRRQLRQLRL